MHEKLEIISLQEDGMELIILCLLCIPEDCQSHAKADSIQQFTINWLSGKSQESTSRWGQERGWLGIFYSMWDLNAKGAFLKYNYIFKINTLLFWSSAIQYNIEVASCSLLQKKSTSLMRAKNVHLGKKDKEAPQKIRGKNGTLMNAILIRINLTLRNTREVEIPCSKKRLLFLILILHP